MTYNIIYVLLVLINFWTSAIVQAHNCEIQQQQQQHYITATNSNILEFLKQLSETSKLVSILDQTILPYLTDSKNENITFFAPNNHALANNTSSNINWEYHILPNFCQLDWTTEPIFQTTRYNNHSLVKLFSDRQGQKIIESGLIQHANVTKSIQINNGSLVVHIIDQVLTVPQNLTTTLTKLGLTKAKVMFDSSPPTVTAITVFAPKNEAFGTVDPSTFGDYLLAQSHVSVTHDMTSNLWINGTVLKSLNHLNMTISKQQQISNNMSFTNWQVSESIQYPSKIITLDILLENGVMHIIDQVLWAANNNWDRVTTTESNASQIKLFNDWWIITLLYTAFLSC